ncbi:MAG: IS110 family transposase [Candidatus Atribacteria bacterium]|nr:IS110 family transposase [Candidatus Atribacteria bacterium]
MGARNAIGIDPDSKGFVCAYVKLSETKVPTRGYMATEADLERFLKWVKDQGDVIVGIEGSNGLSKPIEQTLREAGVIFYSFKPADTDMFRKAVVGQNKDNKKDAESVARYAMALESQGKLDRYRRVWFADMELQILTRGYERNSEAMTAEVNRLWKLLRLASPDLYLALGGNNPEVELKQNMLQSQGILALLGEKPNVGEWKNLSDEEFLSAMGGNSKGRHALIQELRKVAAKVKPVTPGMALMIQGSAGQIERFKREQRDITKMLDELTKECPEVQRLKEMRGIGTITATTMIAEIIDIRRFVREDNLASYSGFGRREHSTGESTRMVSTRSFNHRLKDIFMTAARNYVLYNPDSHLAGYYRNLVKAGMDPMEATKRVARALVRVIFRTLSSLVEKAEGEQLPEQNRKAGESDMASGSLRSDRSHESNISLSSLRGSKAKKAKRDKRAATRTRRNGRSEKGKAVSKKIA